MPTKTTQQKAACLKATLEAIEAVQRMRSDPGDVVEEADGSFTLTGKVNAIVRMVAHMGHCSLNTAANALVQKGAPLVLARHRQAGGSL